MEIASTPAHRSAGVSPACEFTGIWTVQALPNRPNHPRLTDFLIRGEQRQALYERGRADHAIRPIVGIGRRKLQRLYGAPAVIN